MKINIFLSMVGNVFGISKCVTEKWAFLQILVADQEIG